eukprot:Rmarinus@m.9512
MLHVIYPNTSSTIRSIPPTRDGRLAALSNPSVTFTSKSMESCVVPNRGQRVPRQQLDVFRKLEERHQADMRIIFDQDEDIKYLKKQIIKLQGVLRGVQQRPHTVSIMKEISKSIRDTTVKPRRLRGWADDDELPAEDLKSYVQSQSSTPAAQPELGLPSSRGGLRPSARGQLHSSSRAGAGGLPSSGGRESPVGEDSFPDLSHPFVARAPITPPATMRARFRSLPTIQQPGLDSPTTETTRSPTISGRGSTYGATSRSGRESVGGVTKMSVGETADPNIIKENTHLDSDVGAKVNPNRPFSAPGHRKCDKGRLRPRRPSSPSPNLDLLRHMNRSETRINQRPHSAPWQSEDISPLRSRSTHVRSHGLKAGDPGDPVRPATALRDIYYFDGDLPDLASNLSSNAPRHSIEELLLECVRLRKGWLNSVVSNAVYRVRAARPSKRIDRMLESMRHLVGAERVAVYFCDVANVSSPHSPSSVGAAGGKGRSRTVMMRVGAESQIAQFPSKSGVVGFAQRTGFPVRTANPSILDDFDPKVDGLDASLPLTSMLSIPIFFSGGDRRSRELRSQPLPPHPRCSRSVARREQD